MNPLQCLVFVQGQQPHQERLGHLSFADSLDYPVLLAQRAAIVLFHPQGHAAVVEGMVTLSPDHNTVLLLVFSLTSKAGIHHLDPADGTGIALNVPAPHGYRVPLLEREHLVASRLGACAPGVRRKDAGFLAVLQHGMTFNTPDNVNKTQVKQTSANVFQTKVNRKTSETFPSFWRAASTSQILLVKWLFTGKMYFVENLE